jgi:hypothetical protein
MFSTFITLLFAFTPGSWNAEHAKGDVAWSDLIVTARRIGIRQVVGVDSRTADGRTNHACVRSSIADFSIAKVHKGAEAGRHATPGIHPVDRVTVPDGLIG